MGPYGEPWRPVGDTHVVVDQTGKLRASAFQEITTRDRIVDCVNACVTFTAPPESTVEAMRYALEQARIALEPFLGDMRIQEGRAHTLVVEALQMAGEIK